jgi:hypothetical protein
MTKISACALFGTVALSIAIHDPAPAFAQDDVAQCGSIRTGLRGSG